VGPRWVHNLALSHDNNCARASDICQQQCTEVIDDPGLVAERQINQGNVSAQHSQVSKPSVLVCISVQELLQSCMCAGQLPRKLVPLRLLKQL
jgi:hypothetical protein